jgi:arginyl-tRNA synthetase
VHPVEAELSTRLTQALIAAFGADVATFDPELRAATRPEFGHFQTNLPLRLAKPLRLAPRAIGQALIDALDVADLCVQPALEGQGFINLTLRPDVLGALVNAMLDDERLGVPVPAVVQRVVVDYSSPNVAKEMHVGHLRSTVIGDALARVLTLAGHDVIRQNHLGDWGTQFGMLIEALLDDGHDGGDLDLAALDALYRSSRARFEADRSFADRARNRVVDLQSGDDDTVAIWHRLVGVSLASFDAMYTRIGALLTDEDLAGESTYNDDLPTVVAGLDAAGMLRESDGAMCVFPPGFTGRDGEPLPVIVRKADGGYGYDATDLAAIRRRVDDLHADRLVYVVDARQSLHFDQVFAVAREAGWLPARVTAQHVAFGMVLGENGRPFKTRTGDTVSLSSLLDEAVAKAAQTLDERGSHLTGDARTETAQAVGIGAVKYADLVNDLERNYVYAVDRMVAMEGNTGPYLQYAHARLATLLAKAGSVDAVVGELTHPAEQRLALLLTGFGGTVEDVAETLEPHRLCAYLHQLATALSVFYEQCPVLKAEPADRATRLALCVATRRVLETGLGLLGIIAPQRM